MSTQKNSICSASDGKFSCGDKVLNNGYCKIHAFFKKLTPLQKTTNIMYCYGCEQIKYWVRYRSICTDCHEGIPSIINHTVIINDKKIKGDSDQDDTIDKKTNSKKVNNEDSDSDDDDVPSTKTKQTSQSKKKPVDSHDDDESS